MSALGIKLRREFTAASGRLLVIVGLIAVGGMSYVGLLSTYRNLEQTRREYYTRCRMADAWLTVRKAPLATLRELEQLPGIAQLRARIRYEVIADLETSDRPLAGRVLSMPRQRTPVINDIELRSGGYFTGRRLNEVIVSHEFAEAHRLHPGSRIHLLLNNRRTELIVTGTAWSSEFAYLIGPGNILPDAAHYGVFYITRDYAEDLFELSGACNEVVCRFAPDASHERMLQQVAQGLDDYGVVSRTLLKDQESHFMLTNEIRQGEQMAITMATLFQLVAALILNLLLLRFVEQQRTTIGTLKAVGYSNGRLARHYLSFGLVTGLIGGLAGCGLGQALSHGLTQLYSEYFTFPTLDTRLHGSLFFQGVGISVLFSLSGALRGVWSVLRLEPAESMRPQAPKSGVRVPLERFRRLWQRIGFQLQMVCREIWRNRLRTVITLLVAMTGSAMMLTSLYYRDSFLYLVAFQFDMVDHSDLTLVLKDEQSISAVADARRLGNINTAEPVLHASGTLVNGYRQKKLSIMGLDPAATLTTPRESGGRLMEIPASGLALDRRLAARLELAAGDSVILIPTHRPEQRIPLTVARVVDNFLGLQVYASRQYLNSRLGEDDSVSGVQLAASSPRQRRELLQNARTLAGLQAINDTHQARETLDSEIIRNLNIVTTCLIGFAGAIFFGSVINTTLITISERQRQIATLHVVGYQLTEIARVFLWESLLLNGVGALLGLPFGWWLCVLSAEAFSSDLFRMPLVIQPVTWMLTPVLAILFCLAAHWVTLRVLRQQDWISALMIKE